MRENSIRYRKLAVWTLTLTLFVIAWGALVRATGSGAGCGEHWPLCNGEVIPPSPTLKTTIEFTHRLTSGLSFLAVLGLWILSRRWFPKPAQARRVALAALFFMVLEALIGAGLVLFGLVDQNDTVARAAAISLHLVNTLFLLSALTVLAFTDPLAPPPSPDPNPSLRRSVRVSLFLFAGLGVTGAITALGDTLLPKTAIGLTETSAHFLAGLRLVHPVMAGLIGAFFIWMHGNFGLGKAGGRFISMILLGWLVGVLNLFLLAPVWTQLIHLFVADIGWITLVLLAHERGLIRFGAHPA